MSQLVIAQNQFRQYEGTRYVRYTNPHTNRPDYVLMDEYVRQLAGHAVDSFYVQYADLYGTPGFVLSGDTIFIDTTDVFSSIYHAIWLNGAYQGYSYARLRDDIVFTTGLPVYSEVMLTTATAGGGGQSQLHYATASQTTFDKTPGNHAFYGTASQTIFNCAPYMKLTDSYAVWVDGALQSFGYGRSGDSVIFTTGLPVYTEVLVVSRTRSVDWESHVFYATASQTTFDCSPYFTLLDGYMVWVNGSFMEYGHSISGGSLVFSTPLSANDEVMILL